MSFSRNVYRYLSASLWKHFLKQLLVVLNPNLYYGQSAEDAILGKLLPETKGFYIDVGAGRPIQGSNTFLFYKRGWNGICIDPILENEILFKKFRPRDIFILGLVDKHCSNNTFWQFEDYEYSTANQEIALKLMNTGKKLLIKQELDCFPLSDLKTRIPDELPFLLCIDTEGFDLQVLQSFDWEARTPDVICVEELGLIESKDWSSDICVFLAKLGYVRNSFTGLSSIYVRNSSK